MSRTVIGILFLALTASPVFGAFDCPDLVRTALTSTSELCQNTGRNQVCYGHTLLQAQPQPGIDSLTFDQPGHRINVAELRSLRLSPMQTDRGEWGVALLRLQANLPAAESRDVTLLTFGDVQLQNPARTPLETAISPMQAFYFTSGAADAGCPEAPSSGLLIQTPEGVGEVHFLINEVAIRLGSTVFFQAQPNGQMTVSTLEGHALVEATGQSQVALTGMQVSVPLDASLAPAGPPNAPQPYDQTLINALPVAYLSARSTIIIEGPVESIEGNTITIYGTPVQISTDDVRRVEVGTVVRVEGDVDGTTIVPIVVIVIPPSAPPAQPTSQPPANNGGGGGSPPANNGGGNEPRPPQPPSNPPGSGSGGGGMGMGSGSGSGS